MTEVENAPYDIPEERRETFPLMKGVGAHAMDPDLERISYAVNLGLDRINIEMCEAVRALPAPIEEKRALQRQVIDPITDLLIDMHDDYPKAAQTALALNPAICSFASPTSNRSIHSFMHDIRNIYTALQSALELYELEKCESILPLITEAEDALRCFIDQRPQNIDQLRTHAERILPIKVVFLGTQEMQALPCSKLELLQIINNAGFNAKQAGASELIVSCMPYEDDLLLYISDNGSGFSTECIETVRAESKANNPLKGNGLGIIDYILKRYGAKFNISNLAQNRGACLKIRFPQH